MNRFARLAAATLAVGASFALTSPAEAGTASCALGAINTAPAQTVNCELDTIGGCTFYYDPLETFPTRVAPETTEYVFCLAL
jgi:hypothetical protein